MRHITLLFTLIASVGLLAQENQKNIHIIDISYKKCLNLPENQNTHGRISCAIEAKKAWEAELIKYFQLLQRVINPEQKKQLIASQEAWKKYKEQEFRFSSDLYFGIGGTIWHYIAADSETEFVKQRALWLKSYYSALSSKNK